MRCIAILAFAVALGCSGDPSPSVADIPSTHELIADGDCGGCRIVAETLAVLGQETDTVAINEAATPAVDSRGRFYVLEKGGGRVLVFAPDGKLLSTFGRKGKGPGEFSEISEIHAGPADTLVIVGGGVIHIVDPSYKHVRQKQLVEGSDGEFFNTMLSDGRVLRMSGENEFRLLRMDGSLEPAVPLQNVDTTRCMDCGFRTFREAVQPGAVWSGQQNKYRIEMHSLTGELKRGFVRRAHWFTEWKPYMPGDAMDMKAEFSKPRFFGVQQSREGLLWTHVLMVDDPDKLPTPAAMSAMESDASGEPSAAAKKMMADLFSNFVTMMEVIDPETKMVLASREFKMIVVPMRRDLVAQIKLDEFGDWTIVVMRLRVEGRS